MKSQQINFFQKKERKKIVIIVFVLVVAADVAHSVTFDVPVAPWIDLFGSASSGVKQTEYWPLDKALFGDGRARRRRRRRDAEAPAADAHDVGVYCVNRVNSNL